MFSWHIDYVFSQIGISGKVFYSLNSCQLEGLFDLHVNHSRAITVFFKQLLFNEYHHYYSRKNNFRTLKNLSIYDLMIVVLLNLGHNLPF